jgi:hypothetical protein
MSQLVVTTEGDSPAQFLDTTTSVESGDQYLDFIIPPGVVQDSIIKQVGHGLSVEQVVRFNGTIFVPAQADTPANAEVAGIVSAVAGPDIFYLHFIGPMEFASLVPQTVYFLSNTVAGLLTATEPPAIGAVSKPLVIATSATEGYFFNFRGMVIPAPVSSTVGLTGDVTGTGTGTIHTTLVSATSPNITTGLDDANGNRMLGFIPITGSTGNLAINNSNGATQFSLQGTANSFYFTPVGSSGVVAILNGTGASYASGALQFGPDTSGNIACVINNSTATGMQFANIARIYWSATGSAYGGSDIGLARNAVNRLEVNNGTPNQYATLVVGTRDAGTNNVALGLIVEHQTTATPVAGFGTAVQLNAFSSSGVDTNAGRVAALWTDPNDATKTAALDFALTANAAAQATKMRLFGSGGLSVNNTTDPGAGIISANTGYRTGVSAPTTGTILKSDGTAFKPSTETYAPPGASGNVLSSDGTNWISITPTGAPSGPAGGVLTGTYPNPGITTLNQNTAGSAATLTTPRNINQIAFDGSANIVTPAIGAAGTNIRSDGTNWNASPFAIALPGVSGNVMTSDGINWASAAPISMTKVGDAAYTILPTDRVVATNAALTVARTWTLPAANSVLAGQSIIVTDLVGAVTQNIILTVLRAGSDTITTQILPTATAVNFNKPFMAVTFTSDGVSKWSVTSTNLDGWVYYTFGANAAFTSAVQALTDITPLVSDVLLANVYYETEIMLLASSSDTGGMFFGINSPGVGAQPFGYWTGATSANLAGTLTNCSQNNINSTLWCTVSGFLQIKFSGIMYPGSSGTTTITPRVRKNTSGTATINNASYMKLRRL